MVQRYVAPVLACAVSLFCLAGPMLVEGAEITAVASVDAQREAYFDSVIADMQKQWPGLKLTLLGGGSGKVDTLIAAGTPPDLQRVGFETFGRYASQGVMYDLTPILQRAGLGLDAFFPATARAVRWGNAIYGIPFDVKIPVLIYNKEMLDAAGIAPITKDWFDPAWSIDAYYALAKRLTIDINGDGVPDQYGLHNLGHYDEITTLEALGAYWVSDDEKTFTGDSREMRRALEYWTQVNRDVVGGDFYKGTAAMTINLTHRIEQVEGIGLTWDIAAVPREMPLYFSANAWRFYKGSNTEAAWEFIKRIAYDPRLHALGAALFGGLPSLPQALSITFNEKIGLGAYLDAAQRNMLLRGMSDRAQSAYGAGRVHYDLQGMGAVYKKAVTGEISPDQAIEEARAAFMQAVRR